MWWTSGCTGLPSTLLRGEAEHARGGGVDEGRPAPAPSTPHIPCAVDSRRAVFSLRSRSVCSRSVTRREGGGDEVAQGLRVADLVRAEGLLPGRAQDDQRPQHVRSPPSSGTTSPVQRSHAAGAGRGPWTRRWRRSPPSPSPLPSAGCASVSEPGKGARVPTGGHAPAGDRHHLHLARPRPPRRRRRSRAWCSTAACTTRWVTSRRGHGRGEGARDVAQRALLLGAIAQLAGQAPGLHAQHGHRHRRGQGHRGQEQADAAPGGATPAACAARSPLPIRPGGGRAGSSARARR